MRKNIHFLAKERVNNLEFYRVYRSPFRSKYNKVSQSTSRLEVDRSVESKFDLLFFYQSYRHCYNILHCELCHASGSHESLHVSFIRLNYFPLFLDVTVFRVFVKISVIQKMCLWSLDGLQLYKMTQKLVIYGETEIMVLQRVHDHHTSLLMFILFRSGASPFDVHLYVHMAFPLFRNSSLDRDFSF